MSLAIVCWNVQDFSFGGDRVVLRDLTTDSLDRFIDSELERAWLDNYIGPIVRGLHAATQAYDGVVGFVLEVLGDSNSPKPHIMRRLLERVSAHGRYDGHRLRFEHVKYVGNVGRRHEHVILFHRNVAISRFERNALWTKRWTSMARDRNASIRERITERKTRSSVYEPRQLSEDAVDIARDPVTVVFSYDPSSPDQDPRPVEYAVAAVHSPNPRTDTSGEKHAEMYGECVLSSLRQKVDVVIGDFNLGGATIDSGGFSELSRGVGPTTLGRDGRHSSRHDRVYCRSRITGSAKVVDPPADPTNDYAVSDHRILILSNVQIDASEFMESENAGLACDICGDTHGDWSSTWFGRWHRCDACLATYCNICGAYELDRVGIFSGGSRVCRCGQATTLIN